MYNDRPGWSAYIAAKEAFFASHPLANNVLGTDDTIGKLSCEQMREYFARRYVAPNITVVAAGNFEWPAFVDLIAKQCGNWPSGPAVRTLLPVAGNPLTRVVTRPKIIQEHAFLLSPGPAPASELRFSAEILANAVGDDSGSRLYWTLVDPGHADSADMGYHEYDGTGAFCTYFSGEPDRAAENLQKALAVLAEVQKNGITVEELQVARSKLAALLVRRSERTMGRMKAVGFYWSYLKTYRTVDDDLRALDSVSLDTVRQVLDRFPIVEPTVLAFGPLEALE
jgi:predicted Zn-dependent peptidase